MGKTLQIRLCDKPEQEWDELVKRPEFYTMSNMGILLKLVRDYKANASASRVSSPTQLQKESALLDGLTKEEWIDREMELRMEYIDQCDQAEDIKSDMRKVSLAMCKKRYEKALAGERLPPFGTVIQK